MQALYKYPQAEFPYARLVEENRRRSRYEPELELADTGVFDRSQPALAPELREFADRSARCARRTGTEAGATRIPRDALIDDPPRAGY